MQKDCGETTRYHMVKIRCTVAHQEEYDVFLKMMINTVFSLWFVSRTFLIPGNVHNEPIHKTIQYPFPFYHVDFNNHDNHAGRSWVQTSMVIMIVEINMLRWKLLWFLHDMMVSFT